MKKTYQKPQTDITVVQLQHMIALSKIDEDANPNGKVYSRRRGSNWEDDEEDY